MHLWTRLMNVLIVVATTWSCAEAPSDGPPQPRVIDLPVPADLPSTIDEVLAPRFTEQGLIAIEASSTELCRRLSGDLLGRFVSFEESLTLCDGKEPAAIAAAFQTTEAYRVQSMRFWRDQLGTSDQLVRYSYLEPAFSLVEQLHMEQIRYDEFVIELLAMPAFVAQYSDVVVRARRIHETFLGGPPTQAMAFDLAQLARVWDPRGVEEGFFSGIQLEAIHGYVVPGRCGQLGRCETSIVEGGLIQFPAELPDLFAFQGIPYQNLTEGQRAALRGLGEFVVNRPTFWETGADFVLDRLLGWSDGGREPRRPGVMFPAVRRLVADHLKETGSIPSAERLVIGSLLYRQTNDQTRLEAAGQMGKRPVWGSGPLKFTSAEIIMNTLRADGGAMGSCDVRYADDTPYAQHVLNVLPTAETVERWNEFMTEFHARQGNWQPLVMKEVELRTGGSTHAVELDHTYRDLARLFGGCTGAQSSRLTALDGLPFAYGEEVATDILCTQHAASATDVDLSAAVDRLVRALFGRRPTPEETELFADHSCDGCDLQALVAGACVALAGSSEMIFY